MAEDKSEGPEHWMPIKRHDDDVRWEVRRCKHENATKIAYAFTTVDGEPHFHCLECDEIFGLGEIEGEE